MTTWQLLLIEWLRNDRYMHASIDKYTPCITSIITTNTNLRVATEPP